jgi:hypothetical protein
VYFQSKKKNTWVSFLTLHYQMKLFINFFELQILVQSIDFNNNSNSWTYIWGSENFSAKKCYNYLIGHQSVHHSFKWLWKSHYQAKHKVCYWLLLQNRPNTKGLLRRKNMVLDSYTCGLRILQKDEKLRHLFFRCPFAK